MKNITCTNDNVLIKATIKKSIIVMPDAKDKKLDESAEIEKIEVIKIGDMVKKQMKDLREGDIIITDANALHQPNVNSEIGIPNPTPDMQEANFYFFIKSFSIIGIVK